MANNEIPPIPVTVIGETPLTGVTVKTENHLPDVIIHAVKPVVAIAIRFLNTFLTGLLGILTGAMATNVIQASDFIHLVYKCAGLAVAGAGMGLIKDLVTIFGKLEQSHPLATGSV